MSVRLTKLPPMKTPRAVALAASSEGVGSAEPHSGSSPDTVREFYARCLRLEDDSVRNMAHWRSTRPVSDSSLHGDCPLPIQQAGHRTRTVRGGAKISDLHSVPQGLSMTKRQWPSA